MEWHEALVLALLVAYPVVGIVLAVVHGVRGKSVRPKSTLVHLVK